MFKRPNPYAMWVLPLFQFEFRIETVKRHLAMEFV